MHHHNEDIGLRPNLIFMTYMYLGTQSKSKVSGSTNLLHNFHKYKFESLRCSQEKKQGPGSAHSTFNLKTEKNYLVL